LKEKGDVREAGGCGRMKGVVHARRKGFWRMQRGVKEAENVRGRTKCWLRKYQMKKRVLITEGSFKGRKESWRKKEVLKEEMSFNEKGVCWRRKEVLETKGRLKGNGVLKGNHSVKRRSDIDTL
jgi:hypothetical protein